MDTTAALILEKLERNEEALTEKKRDLRKHNASDRRNDYPHLWNVEADVLETETANLQEISDEFRFALRVFRTKPDEIQKIKTTQLRRLKRTLKLLEDREHRFDPDEYAAARTQLMIANSQAITRAGL